MLKQSLSLKSNNSHDKKNSTKNIEKQEIKSAVYNDLLKNESTKCLRQSLNIAESV